MAASALANGYIIALISAIPATIGSIAAWRNAKANRRENTDDHAKVVEHLRSLDTKVEKVDLAVSRVELRLDTIEDKVERHLGWHRAEAEADLPEVLKKEYKGEYPNQPNP